MTQKTILVFLLYFVCGSTQASGTLDWSSVGWPNGSLSNTYTGLGTENLNITVNISGQTGSFFDSSPRLFGEDLMYRVDHPFRTSVNGSLIQTNINFSQPVKNPSFGIRDIDFSSGLFRDIIVILGVTPDGTIVYPSIVSSAFSIVSGANNNQVTGVSADNARTVTSFQFNGLVSEFVFGYFNGLTNMRRQAIWITDISWVDTEVDISVSKTDSTTDYMPGGTGTYSVVVSNSASSDPLVNGTFQDTLPDGVTLSGAWSCTPASSCSPSSGGSVNDTSVTTSLSILPGESVTVTIPVQYSEDIDDY